MNASPLRALWTSWGDKVLPEHRIQAMDTRLRRAKFTDEEIDRGVDWLLDNHGASIPVYSDLRKACLQARRHIRVRDLDRKKRYRPGDTIDGQATMTPAEAAAQLARLEAEYPHCFDGSPEPEMPRTAASQASEAGRAKVRAHLEYRVTRFCAQALRRCANLDPHVYIEPTQAEMF